MTPTPPSEDRFGAADQVLRDVLDADPEIGPDAPATSGMLGRLLSNRDVAILIVAVVLFALFALAGPRFLSENNLVDIARRAAILGILWRFTRSSAPTFRARRSPTCSSPCWRSC